MKKISIDNRNKYVTRDSKIEHAIKQRNIVAILKIMFEDKVPVLKPGFRTETELWDYKNDCPRVKQGCENAWADFAKEVLAFYNNKGGIIIFGINDKDFKFTGATFRLDSKLVNDQLRKYLSDRIWVEYCREFIQDNQRYLGIALIPPRGPFIEKFINDAPLVKGKRLFKKEYSAIREKDSTRILSTIEANKLSRSIILPNVGRMYAIDEPYYRILNPEYNSFVTREKYCDEIQKTIRDTRTAIAAITGIGGVGKTALATWATLKAYDTKDFDFIVSLTAKDRELTRAGIKALKPTLTSYESLLNSIFDVLGFPGYKLKSITEKEKEIKNLISNSYGLLYIDNLETVDDKRIIHFLDELPKGMHAITTSRRTTVRVSTRPIEVGPFTDKEIVKYIKTLSKIRDLGYIRNLSDKECIQIGEACDKIPLAVRWALSRSRSAKEALLIAGNITKSRKHSDELLEFCFRRVFETMQTEEKAILQVLSLFQRPLPIEAIVVGSNMSLVKFQDVIELLVNDALIQRLFDPNLNDYTYVLLPIIRAFVYSEVAKQSMLERTIRKRLSDYFEAKDIKDEKERLVIRELRQGGENPEMALIDLAVSAQTRGDIINAEKLFRRAYNRNPNSWRTCKAIAEFYKKNGEFKRSIEYYDKAAANAPRRGPKRFLIFRERGLLYRKSGLPNATDIAIENLNIALLENPDDLITICILAKLYYNKGIFMKVIELLEPHIDSKNEKTRKTALPLLKDAYRKTGDIIKAARIEQMINDGRKGFRSRK